MALALRPLTEGNFADYEALTRAEASGKTGCYCAFWHQKFTSSAEWERRQKEEPQKNRDAVLARVRGGFHVGVLAYDGDDLLAWISVGPVNEVYWAWKRAAALGPDAATTAAITCFSLAPQRRGDGLQTTLLEALVAYGMGAGWLAIEGYPFDAAAFERHGAKVAWPGAPQGFQAAGFEVVGPHWLTHPEWPRSIMRRSL